MNCGEHYEQGELQLDKLKSGAYDVDQCMLLAAVAQAHFLAALCDRPPLREVAPVGRESIIVGGVFET